MPQQAQSMNEMAKERADMNFIIFKQHLITTLRHEMSLASSYLIHNGHMVRIYH